MDYASIKFNISAIPVNKKGGCSLCNMNMQDNMVTNVNNIDKYYNRKGGYKTQAYEFVEYLCDHRASFLKPLENLFSSKERT